MQVQLAQLCALTYSDLEPCIKATLDRGYGSRLRSTHEYLEIGDIVQYLTVPDLDHYTFINQSYSTHGAPQFFVIGGFYR